MTGKVHMARKAAQLVKPDGLTDGSITLHAGDGEAIMEFDKPVENIALSAQMAYDLGMGLIAVACFLTDEAGTRIEVRG